MALHITPLTHADVPLLQAHFDRHRAETGRGEPHFMPFAPDSDDGPRGLDSSGLDRALDEPRWQRWFIAAAADRSRVVGHVNLKGSVLRVGLHRCELGIGVERPFRGRGLGRRLLREAIGLARSTPSIDWLDLRVFADNAPARALYRKTGFIELATMTDRFRIGDDVIDDVVMTLNVA